MGQSHSIEYPLEHAEETMRESKRVFTQATKNHATAIIELLSRENFDLPPFAESLVRRCLKSFRFTSSVSIQRLAEALVTLRVYGYGAQTLPVVERLASVKFVRFGMFEDLRMIVHDARWAATQHGLNDLANQLSRNVYDPWDYGARVRDTWGDILHLPLDPGQSFPTPRFWLSALTTEILLISMLWAYGGNEEWPLERLEEYRQRLEDAILGLPAVPTPFAGS